MKKFVKHSITQTKEYACSSGYAKDIARNAAWGTVIVLVVEFMKNVVVNYSNEED